MNEPVAAYPEWKPCPFCAAEVFQVEPGEDYDCWVRCLNCNARARATYWNNRPTTPEPCPCPTDPTDICPLPDNLEQAILKAINYWSGESASNTPDYILAKYLMSCLEAWNWGVRERDRWYGGQPPNEQ